jgi:type I restriction enzyme R subunit
VIDHLTEHGVMSVAVLYESPFTDITPRGPDDIFTVAEMQGLLAILDEVRATALAA